MLTHAAGRRAPGPRRPRGRGRIAAVQEVVTALRAYRSRARPAAARAAGDRLPPPHPSWPPSTPSLSAARGRPCHARHGPPGRTAARSPSAPAPRRSTPRRSAPACATLLADGRRAELARAEAQAGQRALRASGRPAAAGGRPSATRRALRGRGATRLAAAHRRTGLTPREPGRGPATGSRGSRSSACASGSSACGALLDALGHPERAAPAIHVVGTNGKSSTARLAAAALGGAGPAGGHVPVAPRHRLARAHQVDGRAGRRRRASPRRSAAVRDAADGLELPDGRRGDPVRGAHRGGLLDLRAGARATPCVVEAGLGGRYDATNVLPPGAVVALTNIALEHTELLGDTEEAIAAEKLAVGPDGSDRLVVGRLSGRARARPVAAECARRGLRRLALRRRDRRPASAAGVDVTTPGAVYPGLAAAARRALPARQPRRRASPPRSGCWASRLDPAAPAARRGRGADARPAGGRSPARPLLVLDGAHNPAGVRGHGGVASGGASARRRPVAVVSVLGDKDARRHGRGRSRRCCRAVVATRSSHPRARRAGGPRGLAARGRAARARPSPTRRRPSRRARGARAPAAPSWSPAPCTCWPICARDVA